jgi:LuxR family transcriptional regulator of spore coat protein
VTEPPTPRPLTRRQRETLLLAANGNSNQEIAAWRGITPNSVAQILTAAYHRLGARDRAQAVAIALAIGELGVHEIHIPDQQREAAA